MPVRFSPGGVLKVDLPDGKFAYAVMLTTSPHVAFYEMDTKLSDGVPPDRDPMFIVAVERSAYVNGGWGSILFHLRPADLPPVPPFFRQNVMRPEDCEIDEPDGTSRPATPDECEGLERSAVWAAPHVESRLEDHYAGRENAFLETMRLKR
jgi:hypothetical protein